MNADVEKAMQRLTDLTPCGCETFRMIWQALRDQEAVTTAQASELCTMRGEYAKEFKRAERAEALLREVLPLLHPHSAECVRITAHLGAEQ